MQITSKSLLLNIFFSILFCNILFAQTEQNTSPKKYKVEISGNFIVATDFESVYTCYGGPSVKFSFSKNVYASISMFPSLRWKNEPNKPTVLPILGTGIHFGYKSFILAFCFYYISSKNKWVAAPGIGVKF